MELRSSNPTLNERTFSQTVGYGQGEVMTMQGAVNKTLVLLFLVVVAAACVWNIVGQAVSGNAQVSNSAAGLVLPFMIGGAIGGFVVALVTVFKKSWAPVTAPIYAVCEGLVLGALSALFERTYPGIVVQAVSLTFGTLFCLLLLYKTGLIKPSENFKMGVFAATGAIALVYFASWILSFFHRSIPMIQGSGWFGIGFSLFVVVIAALNLILDFDFIEEGSKHGVPKYMEWYSAFGLLVTLVWLYMEILRLLSKLRDRK